MAGSGVSLRRILTSDSLSSSFMAFGAAGVISCGPWIISIVGILILGILVSSVPAYHLPAAQFQTIVTYLIAISLIFSGFAQHGFSRFISNQLYLKNELLVIPSLNGMTLLMTASSGILAFIMDALFFTDQSLLFQLSLIGSFVVLCNIWVAASLLTGLKDYSLVLVSFCGECRVRLCLTLLRDRRVFSELFYRAASFAGYFTHRNV